MEGYLDRSGVVFLGSRDDYNKAEMVIYGAPMDFTVSFRSGARLGPERIRESSDVLEEYSPYVDKSLNQVSYIDMGNLILPVGNVKKTLEIIEEYTNTLINDDKTPFLLGGEHLVSYPAVKALHAKYPGLKVIQLDAHADLREEYEGEEYTHATVMRRICDIIGPENLFQAGIRSGTAEEFKFGVKYTNFYFDNVFEVIGDITEKCGDSPVYLTLDIDVFDPSVAPGTGTPEPCGPYAREIFNALYAMKGINIIGCDIVEVAPPYDNGDITSILAAKLVREILLNSHLKPIARR